MSIHLEIEPYCDDCPHFEAETETSVLYSMDLYDDFVCTKITCVNADKCRMLMKHLETIYYTPDTGVPLQNGKENT